MLLLYALVEETSLYRVMMKSEEDENSILSGLMKREEEEEEETSILSGVMKREEDEEMVIDHL